MASWSVPTIFATGDVLDVASANTWSNDLTFLYQTPYINAYAASVAVSANTYTQLPMTGTQFSAYGASVDTSTGNIALPLAGLYWVFGQYQITFASSQYQFWAEIYQNGDMVLQGTVETWFGGPPSVNVGGIILASTADTIGLWAWQNSPSTGDTVGGNNGTNLSAFFIGST